MSADSNLRSSVFCQLVNRWLMPQYYIEQGVRRAVAAREAGLSDIPAVIYEPGMPPVAARIALTDLHSPKAAIARDYRYIRDTEYRTRVLKTEPPAIFVQPLGLAGQKKTTPLLQVVLH
jgi:hypothetical protein